jgi:hypothetical protein
MSKKHHPTARPDGTPNDNSVDDTTTDVQTSADATLESVPSVAQPHAAPAIPACPFCRTATARPIAPGYNECRSCEATFADDARGLAFIGAEVRIDGPFRNGRAIDQCARHAPATILTPTAVLRAAARHGYRDVSITTETIILRFDGIPSGD